MSSSSKFDRRSFLTRASVGGATAAAASTLAAPALAQEMPVINWRMASSFPKALDTIHGGADKLARMVREATDGRFNIKIYSPGEIVGGLEATDAVSNGTVDACHTMSYYNAAKDPAWAVGSTMPFGLSARARNAWLYHGGGIELFNKFLVKQNIYGLPGGNTGAQMGGWYRNEIHSMEDMKGLRIRIGGFGAKVLERIGAKPQLIPAKDVYASLENGTIDGAEWVGPYDDQKMGFYKVAPYYYYPGWWEGGATVHFFFNNDRFQSLPKLYRSILHMASQAADADVLQVYDHRNPVALRELVANGAKLLPFPPEVLDACFTAATEVYDELSTHEDWKTIWDSITDFRDDWYLYNQTTEYSYNTFMMIQQRKGTL